MIDYFSEKFFDGLMKVAKEVDNDNQAKFKKLEKELNIAQTQYSQVVEQNRSLQREMNDIRELFYVNETDAIKYKEALERIRQIANGTDWHEHRINNILTIIREVL